MIQHPVVNYALDVMLWSVYDVSVPAMEEDKDGLIEPLGLNSVNGDLGISSSSSFRFT